MTRVIYTPGKLTANVTMEQQPFEDVSPLKHGDFPLSSGAFMYIIYIIYIKNDTKYESWIYELIITSPCDRHPGWELWKHHELHNPAKNLPKELSEVPWPFPTSLHQQNEVISSPASPRLLTTVTTKTLTPKASTKVHFINKNNTKTIPCRFLLKKHLQNMCWVMFMSSDTKKWPHKKIRIANEHLNKHLPFQLKLINWRVLVGKFSPPKKRPPFWWTCSTTNPQLLASRCWIDGFWSRWLHLV